MEQKKRNIIIVTVVIVLMLATAGLALTKQRQDYDNVKHKHLPTIYYFTADWCDYCRIFQPTMQQVKKDYNGKINVLFIDLTQGGSHTDLTSKYNIEPIPALVFLDKDDNFLEKRIGVLTRSAIDTIIRNSGWLQ